jgi:ubiquinone/menaquinone biosynthesis C-methylase UbiE
VSATLWQRLWRRAFFKRAVYDVIGLLLLRHPGLQMLNCGYAEDEYPEFPLTPEQEPERLGYQLYHRLVRYHPITRSDVLEVGCGRGGGARFLAGTFHPHSYLATDASGTLIRAQRRRQGANARLTFAAARAEHLPVPDASQDIVIGVETLSPLADKALFLREVARVLRPGGRLLIADFFYTRPDSRHAASLFRQLAAASPLMTLTDEDWTARAVRALEEDSPRRLAEIDRLPKLFRSAALSFAGTTQSPLYRQLKDGRAVYLHFVLRR